jgi:NAD(P)H dehydrogenase (quinone)
MADDSTLLVSGASGHVGGGVVQALLDRGVATHRVVATTRTPERLDDFAAKGVHVRYADLNDPDSLREAFVGADRVLIIPTVDVFIPGRRAMQNRNGIDAAVAAGASHIVYSAGYNSMPPSPVFFDADHWETEQYLSTIDAGWTILRMGEFIEGHLDQIWARAIETGRMYTAEGDGRVGYTARQDYVRCAAAVLAADASKNKTYTVTGPESLSIHEAMAIVSDVSGSRIEVIQCTPDELATHMREEEQPEWLIPAFLAAEQGISEGRYDIVTDDVERLTGRQPTSLRDFLLQRVQENGSVLRREDAPHLDPPS